jgi:hypothetical protein
MEPNASTAFTLHAAKSCWSCQGLSGRWETAWGHGFEVKGVHKPMQRKTPNHDLRNPKQAKNISLGWSYQMSARATGRVRYCSRPLSKELSDEKVIRHF